MLLSNPTVIHGKRVHLEVHPSEDGYGEQLRKWKALQGSFKDIEIVRLTYFPVMLPVCANDTGLMGLLRWIAKEMRHVDHMEFVIALNQKDRQRFDMEKVVITGESTRNCVIVNDVFNACDRKYAKTSFFDLRKVNGSLKLIPLCTYHYVPGGTSELVFNAGVGRDSTIAVPAEEYPPRTTGNCEYIPWFYCGCKKYQSMNCDHRERVMNALQLTNLTAGREVRWLRWPGKLIDDVSKVTIEAGGDDGVVTGFGIYKMYKFLLPCFPASLEELTLRNVEFKDLHHLTTMHTGVKKLELVMAKSPLSDMEAGCIYDRFSDWLPGNEMEVSIDFSFPFVGSDGGKGRGNTMTTIRDFLHYMADAPWDAYGNCVVLTFALCIGQDKESTGKYGEKIAEDASENWSILESSLVERKNKWWLLYKCKEAEKPKNFSSEEFEPFILAREQFSHWW